MLSGMDEWNNISLINLSKDDLWTKQNITYKNFNISDSQTLYADLYVDISLRNSPKNSTLPLQDDKS